MSEKGKKKAPGKKKAKASSRSGSSSPRSPKKSSPSGSPKSTDKSRLPTESYVPLPAKLPPVCPAHSKPYSAYSYSRDQLLCTDCLLQGVYHPTGSVEEAHRYKLGQVYNLLNSYVYSKKSKLEELLGTVEGRMDEVKEVKTVIERDMRSEFASMNERLNYAGGTKEATLEHYLAGVQGDLDRIQHIIQTLDSVSNDPIDFLRKHAELRDLCELALAKPVKTDIDVGSYDFPKELSETRQVVEDSAGLTALAELKNAAIWELLQGEGGQKQEVDKEAEEELREWVQLTDRYAEELSGLKMQCQLCGCELDETTVNAQCLRNPRDSRHFFAKAKPQSAALAQPPPQPSQPLPEPQDPFSLLRTILRERRIDLYQLMRSRDMLNTGVLDPTEFHQILTSTLGLPSSQAADFTRKYDVTRTGRVQYQLFVKDAMAEEYEVLDRLRREVGSLQEDLRDSDYRGTGVMSVDRFRDVMRRHGFGLAETDLAMQLGDLHSTGEVHYRAFLDRVKLGY